MPQKCPGRPIHGFPSSFAWLLLGSVFSLHRKSPIDKFIGDRIALPSVDFIGNETILSLLPLERTHIELDVLVCVEYAKRRSAESIHALFPGLSFTHSCFCSEAPDKTSSRSWRGGGGGSVMPRGGAAPKKNIQPSRTKCPRAASDSSGGNKVPSQSAMSALLMLPFKRESSTW